jgi:hypothetical protein
MVVHSTTGYGRIFLACIPHASYIPRDSYMPRARLVYLDFDLYGFSPSTPGVTCS